MRTLWSQAEGTEVSRLSDPEAEDVKLVRLSLRFETPMASKSPLLRNSLYII